MRSLRSFTVLASGLALAAAGLLGGPTPSVGKPQRAICPGGRYVVQGGLLPGAPASQVDVVSLGGTPPTATLSIGCGAANLRGKVKLRAVKKGTRVAAQWQNCAGFIGRIRLNGLLTDTCTKLSARLRATGVKVKHDAPRSACGDGFRDADGGEGCEAAGEGCVDGAPCAADCTCPSATTTTTTLPSGACNPLSQQGCAAGEKCTWIIVQDTPQTLGRVGCAPSGSVVLDGACTQGPVGDTTGFDNCAAGLVCIGGTCQDICGFDASPGAACASGYQCTRYSGLFANLDDDPIAGGCVATCNPVTQLKSNGQPCGVNQGCYLLTSATDTVAVCAGAGTLAHGQAITGTAYANSCLSGHMPRRVSSASSANECGALCQVTDVYMGLNVASEGGVTPYTCESKGAAAPSDSTNGESCRYWWAREPFDILSPYSNTVGWCFKHAAFQYDTNGDMTPDAPFPRCIDLTTGDVVPPIGNPPHNDAQYFWCVAMQAALMRTTTVPRRHPDEPPPILIDRIGNWR